MRRWISVAAAIGVAAAATSCTQSVAGTAVVPPGTDPTADVFVTEDGFGIQVGEPFAPAAIEIFTECPRCGELQFFYGDEIAEYLDSGELVVTYRFLTYNDRGRDGYSQMVSNSMFLAAQPDADVTAVEFQDFVTELFWFFDPDEADRLWIADIADEVGLPAQVVGRIAAGDKAIDVDAMDRENEKLLENITPDPGTPTIYDVNTEEVVDHDKWDWLSDLVEAS